MGLRETKVRKRQEQTQIPRLKLTRKTKTTRKIKIKKRIKFELKPLKRHPARLLPISIKNGKSNIKPLSNSLSKVLEIPVPNNIYEIKTMCAILGMHLVITPKEKVSIEKKYEQILEKLIEIYSKLEMKTNLISGNREFIYQMGIISSQLVVNDSLYPVESGKFFYLWKLQNDNSYKIVVEMKNNADEDEH
jgi:hypothetical protein